MRTRALAGVPGPVIFTAARITGSLLQAGHGAVSIQISGPAAASPGLSVQIEDASDGAAMAGGAGTVLLVAVLGW